MPNRRGSNADGQEGRGAWSAEEFTNPSTSLFAVALVSASTVTLVAWADAHIHLSPARWTTKDPIVVRGPMGATPAGEFSSEIVRRAWTTAYSVESSLTFVSLATTVEVINSRSTRAVCHLRSAARSC